MPFWVEPALKVLDLLGLNMASKQPERGGSNVT